MRAFATRGWTCIIITMKVTRANEQGNVHGSIIAIVALSVLLVVFAVFAVWSYLNYLEQKRDVDTKIENAAGAARLEQADKDQKDFELREKEPNRQFAGPADLGSLSFSYPKTWSVYEANDIVGSSGATYEAYLHPYVVPPVTKEQKFALRVTIEQVQYDKEVAGYDKLIKNGSLKSSIYSDGTFTGTLLTGNFSEDIIGTAVLLKMRDRTLTIRTDGDVFKADFDKALKTLKFNE